MGERKNLVEVSFKLSLEEHYDLLKEIYNIDKNCKLNETEAFEWALKNNNVELASRLIQSGADVTAVDNYAIRYAAKNGHTEVVKMLIEAGADVAADDNYAIRYATAYGHTEVVKLLIEAGADVTADTIIYATAYGHAEVAKMLIEARSDVDDYSIKSVFLDYISSQIRKLKNFLKNL